MSGKRTPGGVYVIALGFIAGYIVFVTTQMARTPRANRVLWLIALALALGVIALAAGFLPRRRAGRAADDDRNRGAPEG